MEEGIDSSFLLLESCFFEELLCFKSAMSLGFERLVQLALLAYLLKLVWTLLLKLFMREADSDYSRVSIGQVWLICRAVLLENIPLGASSVGFSAKVALKVFDLLTLLVANGDVKVLS